MTGEYLLNMGGFDWTGCLVRAISFLVNEYIKKHLFKPDVREQEQIVEQANEDADLTADVYRSYLSISTNYDGKLEPCLAIVNPIKICPELYYPGPGEMAKYVQDHRRSNWKIAEGQEIERVAARKRFHLSLAYRFGGQKLPFPL